MALLRGDYDSTPSEADFEEPEARCWFCNRFLGRPDEGTRAYCSPQCARADAEGL